MCIVHMCMLKYVLDCNSHTFGKHIQCTIKCAQEKIWQAQDKLNNGGMRTEQAYHCNLKVCCLQKRTKTNGKKPVACTTAHLMHPSSDWTKRARVEENTHTLAHTYSEREIKKKREREIVKRTWESLKKLLKVREDFEHGNGYEIKIIKFGERNLCKRCYLAWNVYVIMSVQCALCSEAVIHSSTRLGSALHCNALHWTVPYYVAMCLFSKSSTL